MTHPLLSPRRSRWIIAPFALVLVIAALWSAFWFYATSAATAGIAEWRAQEERLGRIHSCGSQTLGGFPFRIEVRCTDAGVELRNAEPPLTIRARDVLVVAQVYQPTLLIAEISGPLTIAEAGRPASLVAAWTLAQASARGVPADPERLSLVVDGLRLDRPVAGGTEAVFAADRVELHGRLNPGSMPGNPVVDLAARLTSATAPVAGAIGAKPLDADVTAVLRGLKTINLQPLRVQLRQLQTAGGTLQVTDARVQQADTAARASGTLSLSQRARLDGTLRLTVAGIEPFLARSGLDKLLPGPGPGGTSVNGLNSLAPILGGLDRLVPGLGNVARNNVNAGTLAAGVALLGERTELDGKAAIALPLRFSDGAASLGPIPLGQTAPLY
jgi:hypothetical protein